MDRVIKKLLTDAPPETLLVLDGTNGQNAVSQARAFRNVAGVTGLVITKLDGTAKGGAVLSLRKEVRLPLKYIGVGEKIDDLQRFIADEFIDALFDMTEETVFVESDAAATPSETEASSDPAGDSEQPKPVAAATTESDAQPDSKTDAKTDSKPDAKPESQSNNASSPEPEAPKKKGLFGRLFGR